MTDLENSIERLRASEVAAAIRRERLIVILRRVAPTERVVDLVLSLADAGARIFEVTFDAPTAATDLVACREALAHADADACWVGAGTIRTVRALDEAGDAGAQFVVSPLLDPAIVEAALRRGVPVIPGAFTPTEIDAACRAGATFVKLFPASSVGPGHIRELRGPMPEVELIPTGGIDGSSGPAFLAAGAVAVGIGGAIVNASPAERAAIIAAVMALGLLVIVSIRARLAHWSHVKGLVRTLLIASVIVLPIVIPLYVERFTSLDVSDISADGDTAGRVVVMVSATDGIMAHPLMGNGTASFQLLMSNEELGFGDGSDSGAWIGNTEMRVLHDTGIVGFTPRPA
jgi:2-dehydro-3-deoxyphosphogluconate aldolase/(4S)-4-hydroxy-2-oxoglutarate aldolase